MLAVSKEKLKPNQSSEIGYRVSDEQKWKDIAEEEFEVSSSYSPVDSYIPKFLNTN
jgi:hypothetical protein